MKILKIALSIVFLLVTTLFVVVLIAFGALDSKTRAVMDDYNAIYSDKKYEQPYFINGIEVFEQNVSCGYAVIEMFAKWNNNDITEKSLFDTYGKVVTSTGKSFEMEMNKQFPEYKTTMYQYLKNTDLIDKVYASL